MAKSKELYVNLGNKFVEDWGLSDKDDPVLVLLGKTILCVCLKEMVDSKAVRDAHEDNEYIKAVDNKGWVYDWSFVRDSDAELAGIWGYWSGDIEGAFLRRLDEAGIDFEEVSKECKPGGEKWGSKMCGSDLYDRVYRWLACVTGVSYWVASNT